MPRMYIEECEEDEKSEAKKFAEAGKACAEALMSEFFKATEIYGNKKEN